MALIDKASLLFVPSVVAQEKAFNILPSGNRAPDSTDQNSGYDQTRADFDFDRGSNTAATRVNADGLIEKYRENFILHSQDFSNAVWQTNASATISHGITDPNGGSTASRLTFAASVNSGLYQQNPTSFASGNVRTASLYMKGSVGGEVVMFGDATNRTSVTLTTSWVRYEGFGVDASTYFIIYTNTSSPSADTIDIAFVQYENSLVATDYLESTSVTGKAGVLIDLPRIDYSSGAGALLLEPSRQQLFQYSEYLEHSSWTKSNVTTTSNAAISPEGVQNASKIIGTTSSNFTRAIVSVPAGDITMSAWVKSVDGSNIEFQMGAGSLGASNVGTFIATSEWQRFDKLINIATALTSDFGFFNKSGNQLNLYVYGAQLEAGSYVSSYIPNHGESGGVTRAADSCSVTGASDVIGQTEGTLFWEVDFGVNDSGEYPAVFLYDGTSNNRVLIQRRGNNQLLQYQINAGGSNQVDEFSTTAVGSGKVKIAIAYKANDFVLYLNGSQEASDTSGSTFSGALSQIDFSNTRHDNTYQLALFNERLSNEELATLTTL